MFLILHPFSLKEIRKSTSSLKNTLEGSDQKNAHSDRLICLADDRFLIKDPNT